MTKRAAYYCYRCERRMVGIGVQGKGVRAVFQGENLVITCACGLRYRVSSDSRRLRAARHEGGRIVLTPADTYRGSEDYGHEEARPLPLVATPAWRRIQEIFRSRWYINERKSITAGLGRKRRQR